MLKQVYDELPEKLQNPTGERFEIPKVKGYLQGNKTFMTNFSQIASALHREEPHFMKYLTKELGSQAELKNGVLIFNSKVPSSRINEKIESYVAEFVLCNECKKPDTVFVKEGGYLFLRCNACGAKRPIREIK